VGSNALRLKLSPMRCWLALVLAVGLASVASEVDAWEGRGGRSTLDGTPACNVFQVGVDTSHGNTVFDPALGRAANQVFYAPDTLISSITIWKPAQPDTNVNPMHLFITETDSTAMDSSAGHRPLPSAILLNGPVVDVPYTDGIHPKPVTFTFDPPFALPRRGYFSFAIKEDLCGGVIALLADSSSSYEYGGCWKTVAFNDCSGLGQSARLVPGVLVFQIAFCEIAVPAVGETWGRLKARYR
jgi:hypothetical protein